LNTTHRPKIEEFDDYLFLVLKMLHFDETTGEVGSRHLSLILYRGRVLTFQEVAEDLLAQVRERVRNGRGRIRALGADFLAYAIIDAIVDGYFTVLEKLAVHIEDLEDSLTQDPPAETLQ
ncbi:MAG: magnesium and cobalt transport protein CorA, partial [Gemmatimonadales bacterium]|nr:magnesium and cobalt transport protein CorA [Gemmatimonadales bacterium]